MAERPQPTRDPETILALKDQLLEAWHQLPAEHQASMALALIKWVQSGEYGRWLGSSIAVLREPPSSPETKSHDLKSMAQVLDDAYFLLIEYGDYVSYQIHKGIHDAGALAVWKADEESIDRVTLAIHEWLCENAPSRHHLPSGRSANPAPNQSTEPVSPLSQPKPQEPDSDLMTREFAFPREANDSISREDVASVLTDEQVLELTDEDMRLLAEKMSERSDGFWDDLEYFATQILKTKRRSAQGGNE